MNYIDGETLRKANREAIFNLYLYIASKALPIPGQNLSEAVKRIEKYRKTHPNGLTEQQMHQLSLVKAALDTFPFLSGTVISEFTYSKSGLCAFVFEGENNETSVAFKGTGSGEWLDNGEGLSGIPRENTYLFYSDAKVIRKQTVKEDYATDRQVEALNWFRYTSSKNKWNKQTKITLSGHSKGGNKAQFITAHSDIVKECYSFDGQGFSPEAVGALKAEYGKRLDERCRKILSLSADNDYVNVLGERLMPEENIHFFKASDGLHPIEAILDQSARLRKPAEQGRLSQYIESVSEELMKKPAFIRQYATGSVTGILQQYLGKFDTGKDVFSIGETAVGIGVALDAAIKGLS